jgi:hypothetical protein
MAGTYVVVPSTTLAATPLFVVPTGGTWIYFQNTAYGLHAAPDGRYLH